MFKKIFLLLFLISFVSVNSCIAETSDYMVEERKFVNYQTNNTIEKMKIYRRAVYSTLEITPPQAIEIKKLDKEFYGQIKPILTEDFYTMNRLSRLTSKPKPSKGLVNVEKKKLKANSKVLDSYTTAYENDLYKILTPTQKSKYMKLKKDKVKEYKASF